MAAINFPASPNVDDEFTVNAVTYVWTGVFWRASTTPAEQTLEPFFVNIDGDAMTGPLTVPTANFIGKVNHSIYALTGTTPSLNAANGTIQTWTLTDNSTPTDGLSNGDYVILMIDDGTAFSITWPSVSWRTTAPTLKTTGYTMVTIWKVGDSLYGAW